ncbi:MAG: hypothetical protein WBW33_27345 [Bryobacteraceae bacterium]
MRAVCCLVLGLFALSSSRAQTIHPININIIPTGEVVGAIVGIAAVAVAGVGITYYVVNKGVAEGCVVEADGKKTLVESDKKVYSVMDGGPSLPVGDNVKLKGHKSGTKSAPSIQVEKVLKVYGPCKPK